MKNITFDSTSFSEQLGLYDFFNLILAGATFICGLSLISEEIKNYLWNNLSFQKGLGIILLIYILGMILQEIGSLIDRYVFRIYEGMNCRILKGKFDDKYEGKIKNSIIRNPIVLERYRRNADEVLKEFAFCDNEQRFENDNVNGYVFSICQYYVSIHGKDKKVEKLRALFAMSKTLIACFFLLSILVLISILVDFKPTTDICDTIRFSIPNYKQCIEKIIYSILFAAIGFFFVFRAKRVMKNFLLVLLGTYDAIVRSVENKRNKVVRSTKKVNARKKLKA